MNNPFITSGYAGAFSLRHHLVSVSSVNSAVKGLLERNIVTCERGIYSVYDKFFELWLRRNFAVQSNS